MCGRCKKVIGWTIVGLVAAYGIATVAKSEMEDK